MHAVQIKEHGGPEVMRWTELPDPTPGPGEVLVRLGVAGVNYMDTGARAQGGPGWAAPAVLGAEGMGYVTTLGAGVGGLAAGDRVAWFCHPGSYAELLAIPADSLVKVPHGIVDETAAAVMLQGIAASHLSTEAYPVKPGHTAVVHAAAGGVGLLLTQMIKARGGKVIGLVSLDAAQAVARELLRHWQAQLTAGIRDMQDIGEIAPGLDADREAAALLAGVQGGVMILMTTGGMEHLEAALDQGIAHLRGAPAASPSAAPA
ncbi:alcohol dehydrogenase catalytic domain-containing protein [Streptomyces roseoverticillatus]|uniref:alcohol dehydrogenase catalytic domain-containing protein n=1 Tax=Streptomyces roseoverticillatus TaxID=66429 RepID=UPI00340301D4